VQLHLTLRICKPCGEITWPPGAARKEEMHIFRPRQNTAPRGQTTRPAYALGVVRHPKNPPHI